jgi:sugar lactone lactonase YvrE/DNA-binding transcriptional ArsR family regulator
MISDVPLGGETEGQDFRAELFESIGHPTRIKILQVLNERPMGFADLKRAVGIQSSGNMSFHLTKLRHLVMTGADGNYVLTDDGKEALWSIGSISTGAKGQEPDWKVRRIRKYRLRIALTSLVVGLLLLSSVAAFQQQELASQQDQIYSQQQKIGAYAQLQPFTSGQSAALVLGQKNFTSYSRVVCAGIAPESYQPTDCTKSGLATPVGARFDNAGNLWVSELSGRLVEFSPPFSSGMDASFVLTGMGGGTFDSSGNIWVPDAIHDRILEFRPPFVSGMPASLVLGQRNFTYFILGVSKSEMNNPNANHFDSAGDLWVLDSGNNRVLEFKPPFSNGMNASLVIGQSGFEQSGSSRTRGGFYVQCGDLAIDPSGNLWVGDCGNNRILEFNPPFSNGMNASLVIGQTSFTARQPSPGLNPSRIPYANNFGWAINFDAQGNLWATFHQRVVEFKPPFTTGMSPSLEIGQPDFTSTAWAGGQSGLVLPNDPGFDSHGNLWVADGANNRVLEFLAGPPNIGVASPSWVLPYFGGAAVTLVVAAVLTDWLVRRRLGQG